MHSIFLWALIHFAPSIHWTYVTRIWGKWVSSPKIPAPMPVTFLVFFAPTYKAVAFRWYQLNYNLQVQIPHDCFEAKCVCRNTKLGILYCRQPYSHFVSPFSSSFAVI